MTGHSARGSEATEASGLSLGTNSSVGPWSRKIGRGWQLGREQDGMVVVSGPVSLSPLDSWIAAHHPTTSVVEGCTLDKRAESGRPKSDPPPPRFRCSGTTLE